MKVTQKSERLSMQENYRLKRIIYRVRQRCNWCQEPLTMETATLDHLTPLARGGSNRLENLTLACWHCNQLRSREQVRLLPFLERGPRGERPKYRNGRVKHEKPKLRHPIDPMQSECAKRLKERFKQILAVDTRQEK